MPPRRDLAPLVARTIAERRVASGLTQEDLAARLDIATKNLQRIESGKQNLTLRTIERIADALRVDRTQLLAVAVAPPERERRSKTALGLLVDAGFVVIPASQRRVRPPHAVPVVDLLAAGGPLPASPRAVDTLGWTVLRRRAPPSGLFAAQIAGDSMAPRVPDGAVCLFGAARSPIEGRIALLEGGALAESGLTGSYAVKLVGRVTHLSDGRTRMVLRSVNPAYAPLVVEAADDDELRVVAELLEVLARPTAP